MLFLQVQCLLISEYCSLFVCILKIRSPSQKISFLVWWWNRHIFVKFILKDLIFWCYHSFFFLIFKFSSLLVVVYRNREDFVLLKRYRVPLLNLLTVKLTCRFFWVVYIHEHIVYEERQFLDLLFLSLLPFTCFAFLIALARVCSAVMDRNSNSKSLSHSWFEVEGFQYLTVKYKACFFNLVFINALHQIKAVCSNSTWLRFYVMIKSWVLGSFTTWHLLRWSYHFSLLLICWIILVDFWMLIFPLVPRKSLFGDYIIT